MKAVYITPPAYLLLAIALMALLHFLAPGGRVLVFPWDLLGAIPLTLGIIIDLVADRTFKKRTIAVTPLAKPTVLVTNGVFGISRHPMYLGFVLVLVGIALLLGSVTPYVVVLGFAVFMDVVFIGFEEKKLAETFGEAWLEYKKNVRRWL